MNIGIIGAGEMGICLATKFSNLGHMVSIANARGPASLKQLAKDIGATAVTVEEAAKTSDAIIVSIPQKNVPSLPKDLFKDLSDHVAVMDTGNYYPTLRDGAIPALDRDGIDSAWVQEQLGVQVVKVFNSILATSIKAQGKPKGNNNRIAISIAGNSSKAKEIASKLVDELGFDSLDIGPITQSWKQQPGTSIYCRDISLEELKRRVDAMGATWSTMRDRITAKRKADEILMKADYSAYLQGLDQHDF